MIGAIALTLIYALNLLWWIIVVSAIMSWLYAFNIVNPGNRFVDTVGSSLYRMTEPLYRPIRRILPDLGGIDLSPIVVLIAIFFFEQLLAPFAYNPAYRLGY